jgi:hypothetical protein
MSRKSEIGKSCECVWAYGRMGVWACGRVGVWAYALGSASEWDLWDLWDL